MEQHRVERTQRFKKGVGQAGSRGGCLNKGGQGGTLLRTMKLLKFSAMFFGSDIVLPSTEIDDGRIVLLLFLEYMVSLIPHKALEFFLFF